MKNYNSYLFITLLCVVASCVLTFAQQNTEIAWDIQLGQEDDVTLNSILGFTFIPQSRVSVNMPSLTLVGSSSGSTPFLRIPRLDGGNAMQNLMILMDREECGKCVDNDQNIVAGLCVINDGEEMALRLLRDVEANDKINCHFRAYYQEWAQWTFLISDNTDDSNTDITYVATPNSQMTIDKLKDLPSNPRIISVKLHKEQTPRLSDIFGAFQKLEFTITNLPKNALLPITFLDTYFNGTQYYGDASYNAILDLLPFVLFADGDWQCNAAGGDGVSKNSARLHYRGSDPRAFLEPFSISTSADIKPTTVVTCTFPFAYDYYSNIFIEEAELLQDLSPDVIFNEAYPLHVTLGVGNEFVGTAANFSCGPLSRDIVLPLISTSSPHNESVVAHWLTSHSWLPQQSFEVLQVSDMSTDEWEKSTFVIMSSNLTAFNEVLAALNQKDGGDDDNVGNDSISLLQHVENEISKQLEKFETKNEPPQELLTKKTTKLQQKYQIDKQVDSATQRALQKLQVNMKQSKTMLLQNRQKHNHDDINYNNTMQLTNHYISDENQQEEYTGGIPRLDDKEHFDAFQRFATSRGVLVQKMTNTKKVTIKNKKGHNTQKLQFSASFSNQPNLNMMFITDMNRTGTMPPPIVSDEPIFPLPPALVFSISGRKMALSPPMPSLYIIPAQLKPVEITNHKIIMDIPFLFTHEDAEDDQHPSVIGHNFTLDHRITTTWTNDPRMTAKPSCVVHTASPNVVLNWEFIDSVVLLPKYDTFTFSHLHLTGHFQAGDMATLRCEYSIIPGAKSPIEQMVVEYTVQQPWTRSTRAEYNFENYQSSDNHDDDNNNYSLQYKESNDWVVELPKSMNRTCTTYIIATTSNTDLTTTKSLIQLKQTIVNILKTKYRIVQHEITNHNNEKEAAEEPILINPFINMTINDLLIPVSDSARANADDIAVYSRPWGTQFAQRVNEKVWSATTLFYLPTELNLAQYFDEEQYTLDRYAADVNTATNDGVGIYFGLINGNYMSEDGEDQQGDYCALYNPLEPLSTTSSTYHSVMYDSFMPLGQVCTTTAQCGADGAFGGFVCVNGFCRDADDVAKSAVELAQTIAFMNPGYITNVVNQYAPQSMAFDGTLGEHTNAAFGFNNIYTDAICGTILFSIISALIFY